MGYMPEKMASMHEGFHDESTGSFVGEVWTPGGTDDDDERIAAEISRRWNACAGIDTDRLYPGCVGEMVEALAAVTVHLAQCACTRKLTVDEQIDIEKARAILAKLGKV